MENKDRIFVTGATGNIGTAVLKYLGKADCKAEIVIGHRRPDSLISQFPDYKLRFFDFEKPGSFKQSFEETETVFLLRPPHIADIGKYFRPLFDELRKQKIKNIVFLSVQGAEKSKVIPHNKIERLIKEYSFNYVFLRPSYFMQNLTGELLHDIQSRREILLPAGKAKFNWVDVDDIGKLAARVLCNIENYINSTIEITGSENLNFYQVSEIMNRHIGDKIIYKNLNPFRFFKLKKKQGVPKAKINVMLALHFLPRFQKAPNITHSIREITGNPPVNLDKFVQKNRRLFKAK